MKMFLEWFPVSIFIFIFIGLSLTTSFLTGGSSAGSLSPTTASYTIELPFRFSSQTYPCSGSPYNIATIIDSKNNREYMLWAEHVVDLGPATSSYPNKVLGEFEIGSK
jgi:hypothetical protein